MKKKFLVQRLLGLLLIAIGAWLCWVFNTGTRREDGTAAVMCLMMGLWFCLSKNLIVDFSFIK